MVTKSIPAYHVAIGNPARPVRKVALDVPDAPGLHYERQGVRMVVVPKNPIIVPAAEESPRSEPAGSGSAGTEVSLAAPAEARKEEQRMLGMRADQTRHLAEAEKELMDLIQSMKPENQRLVGIDVVLLVVSVLGAWLIVHVILY